jgi:hypothetical protein
MHTISDLTPACRRGYWAAPCASGVVCFPAMTAAASKPEGISFEELKRLAEQAPIDDEPETPEEAAAVAEAREQYARGEFVTMEEMARLLGL